METDLDLPAEIARTTKTEEQKSRQSCLRGKKMLSENKDFVKRHGKQQDNIPCKMLKMDKIQLAMTTSFKCKDQPASSRPEISGQFDPTDNQYSQSHLDKYSQHPLSSSVTSYTDDSYTKSTIVSSNDKQRDNELPDDIGLSTYNYVYQSPYHWTSAGQICDTRNTMSATSSLSTNTASHLDLENEFLSQLEPDLGYISLSTGSSCQGEGMYLDQPTVRSTQTDIEWDSDGGKIESLIYHFGEFFKNQFVSTIKQYQDDTFSMIEEQKDHVRCIVQSVMADDPSSRITMQSPRTSLLSDILGKGNSSGNMECTSQISQENTVIASESQNQVCPTGSSSQTSRSSVEETEPQIGDTDMVSLMTLTCGISSLLATPHFQT